MFDMPGRQLPAPPRNTHFLLKRPHYVHDYVDLDYYVQTANFALK